MFFFKRHLDDFVAKIETLNLSEERKKYVLEQYQMVGKVIKGGKLPDGIEASPKAKAYPGAFLMKVIEGMESTIGKRLF